MPTLFLCLFRFVRLLISGHQAVALENAALRLQLAAFQRKRKRPVVTAFDRVFWVALRRRWSGCRGPLLYVQADTVTRSVQILDRTTGGTVYGPCALTFPRAQSGQDAQPEVRWLGNEHDSNDINR